MTLVVQSSSATIAVLQNFASQPGPDGIHSVIGLAGAMPILFGDNIGTTITALLASIGQSKNAKRTAIAHSTFNITGTILFMFLIRPLAAFVQWISQKGDELDIISRQIANAHTTFNIACTIIWLPLIPVMVKIVKFIIRGEDKNNTEGFVAKYLDDKAMSQPAAAIYMAAKEISRLSVHAGKMIDAMKNAISGRNTAEIRDKYVDEHDKVKELQDIIVDFVTKLIASGNLTEKQAEHGVDGLKVHSKLCLITRKDDGKIQYITQIGTGNYNEKTSRLYTDLSLMTANEEIGKDAMKVFQSILIGNTVSHADHLLVAPECLQAPVLKMIDDEIAIAKDGQPAYIGVKINSLTDKKIIDKLVEASKAGVKVELIVRGICCLLAGIPGETENIHIRSIVGRFLEHSRIYMFGTPDRDKIYIASADFMTRNTLRRVEVATPIYDEKIKQRIRDMFNLMMRDNMQARIQQPDGTYMKQNRDAEEINSQEMQYAEAYDRARS